MMMMSWLPGDHTNTEFGGMPSVKVVRVTIMFAAAMRQLARGWG
jgi:hypothetical protein